MLGTLANPFFLFVCERSASLEHLGLVVKMFLNQSREARAWSLQFRLVLAEKVRLLKVRTERLGQIISVTNGFFQLGAMRYTQADRTPVQVVFVHQIRRSPLLLNRLDEFFRCLERNNMGRHQILCRKYELGREERHAKQPEQNLPLEIEKAVRHPVHDLRSGLVG